MENKKIGLKKVIRILCKVIRILCFVCLVLTGIIVVVSSIKGGLFEDSNFFRQCIATILLWLILNILPIIILILTSNGLKEKIKAKKEEQLSQQKIKKEKLEEQKRVKIEKIKAKKEEKLLKEKIMQEKLEEEKKLKNMPEYERMDIKTRKKLEEESLENNWGELIEFIEYEDKFYYKQLAVFEEGIKIINKNISVAENSKDDVKAFVPKSMLIEDINKFRSLKFIKILEDVDLSWYKDIDFRKNVTLDKLKEIDKYIDNYIERNICHKFDISEEDYDLQSYVDAVLELQLYKNAGLYRGKNKRIFNFSVPLNYYSEENIDLINKITFCFNIDDSYIYMENTKAATHLGNTDFVQNKFIKIIGYYYSLMDDREFEKRAYIKIIEKINENISKGLEVVSSIDLSKVSSIENFYANTPIYVATIDREKNDYTLNIILRENEISYSQYENITKYYVEGKKWIEKESIDVEPDKYTIKSRKEFSGKSAALGYVLAGPVGALAMSQKTVYDYPIYSQKPYYISEHDKRQLVVEYLDFEGKESTSKFSVKLYPYLYEFMEANMSNKRGVSIKYL